MTHPLYTGSVPVFQQILTAQAAILARAAAHAEAHKIEPDAFLQSRLFPDMWPLIKQVRISCDFAKGTSARLAGKPVPSFEITGQGFADLQSYIAQTLAFIGGLDPALFEGSEARPLKFMAGPNELEFPQGTAYLHRFALPNFFFHATTASGLLRHGGVEVGKHDYLGSF